MSLFDGDLVALARAVLSGEIEVDDPRCDEALQGLARGVVGLSRSDANWKRRSARLADELANHIQKNGARRHQIERLEGVLAWAARTDQPFEKIREVIERTIPRTLVRLGSDVPDQPMHAAEFSSERVFQPGIGYRVILVGNHHAAGESGVILQAPGVMFYGWTVRLESGQLVGAANWQMQRTER